MWSVLTLRTELKHITSVPFHFRPNNYHSLPLNHILQSCSSLSGLKSIHARIIKTGYYQNLPLITKLVTLASSLAPTMGYARNLFDAMPEKDVFLWNTLIRGYADRGPCQEAIVLYRKMHQGGFSPDNYTFPFVVRSCAVQSALREGKEVHCNIIKNGFSSDVYVQSSLVSMYAQNGETLDSELVYNEMVVKNIVSWTAMIAGYVKNGFYKEGLSVMRDMVASGFQPNVVTLVSVLPACASLEFLDLGTLIHCHGVKVGVDSDMSFINALIAFYGKCQSLETARSLFDGMVAKNLVSWNAMIAAYEKNNAGTDAIKLFCRMQNENVQYDYITIVSVISACGSLGMLNTGKWMHELVKGKGFGTNVSITNALIDMYAKCGNIDLAKDIFQKLPYKSVVSWTCIIGACASHGHGGDALMLFSMMKEKGITPNSFTFTAVLTACRHSGLVDEGKRHFESMIKDYSLVPGVEHYACMVDLLGRAGCLLEAYKFIKRMPVEPDVGIWGALLSACRVYSNIELAELVAAHLSNLDPRTTTPYVLMLIIYAEAGRWDDEARLRNWMRQTDLKKLPGRSFVEVNQRLYTFLSGPKTQVELQPMLASC